MSVRVFLRFCVVSVLLGLALIGPVPAKPARPHPARKAHPASHKPAKAPAPPAKSPDPSLPALGHTLSAQEAQYNRQLMVRKVEEYNTLVTAIKLDEKTIQQNRNSTGSHWVTRPDGSRFRERNTAYADAAQSDLDLKQTQAQLALAAIQSIPHFTDSYRLDTATHLDPETQQPVPDDWQMLLPLSTAPPSSPSSHP